MLSIKYWFQNLSKFRGLIASGILLTILLCFFLGMSESTKLIFNRMSDSEIYSVYESNLACPMSGLVPEKYIQTISDMCGVKSVSPEVRQNTVIIKDLIVTILGVKPDKFEQFRKIEIEPEVWEKFVQNPRSILIGKDLAKTIRKKYGRLENDYNIPVEVAGVFNLPLSLLNNMMIAHQDYLKTFLFKGENVTVINVLFEKNASPEVMCAEIENRLSEHKTKLVCRPETTIWERAQVGMAQFGKYVHYYGFFVLAIFLLFHIAQTFRLLNKAAPRNSHSPNINPILFQVRILNLNTLVSVLIGVGLAALIFISRPAFTGFDIFNPPVMVNFPVISKSLGLMFLTGFVANLWSIFLFYRFQQNRVSGSCLYTLALVPVIIIVFTVNFLLSYPQKLRSDLLNGAEPDNLSIYQAGTSVRIRQASNIPNTVLEVCQLAPNIKIENGRMLFTPVVQLAANVNQQNIPTIGVKPELFFRIEPKIKIIEGRAPSNSHEIVIGKNVSSKLKQELSIGDTLEIEGARWDIVGICSANSFYDNFIITEITDLIRETGRETLQTVLIKVANEDKSNETIDAIQKYYGMLLDELPDLPHLSISGETEQMEELAASYNGLFILNIGLVLLATLAGFNLLRRLFSIAIPNGIKSRPLVITLITSTFLINLCSYYLGQKLWFTLALSTFNLQPLTLILGLNIIVIAVILLGIFLKTDIHKTQHTSHEFYSQGIKTDAVN